MRKHIAKEENDLLCCEGKMSVSAMYPKTHAVHLHLAVPTRLLQRLVESLVAKPFVGRIYVNGDPERGTDIAPVAVEVISDGAEEAAVAIFDWHAGLWPLVVDMSGARGVITGPDGWTDVVRRLP